MSEPRLFISDDNVIRFEERELTLDGLEQRLERGKAEGESEAIGVIGPDEPDIEFVKKVLELLQRFDRAYIGIVHS